MHVERIPQSGLFGIVEVFYRTIEAHELYAYLPGGTVRADANDFVNVSDSIIMEQGVIFNSFNISIRDEDMPEIDESVFVILTGVKLLNASQDRPGKLS